MSKIAGSHSYYVERDGETVGHAAIFGTEDPARAHLAWLFLAPHLRGAGLGQRFVDAVEAMASARPGVHRLSLRVDPANGRALHIYEKRGYRITGTRYGLHEMMREIG